MSIYYITDPNEYNDLTDGAALNKNISYGYYGRAAYDDAVYSLAQGSQAVVHGSQVVDDTHTDKALPSGVFAYNNDRPVTAKATTELSTVSNNVLKNMSNPDSPSPDYPGQELFGKEYKYQYIYSNHPRKHRIGVF